MHKDHKTIGTVYRSIEEPIRSLSSWDEKWSGDDLGLIFAWEKGRAWSAKNQNLKEAAIRGELPKLEWSGGYDKALKTDKKCASFFYYAAWLGLRGVDLDIDTSQEIKVTCSKFNMTTTFTADMEKYD